jgi:hypothetical protein
VTHSSILENLSTKRIIDWMNVIREESGDIQYTILENFWASQVSSKAWLINVANSVLWSKREFQSFGNVYICAGWYGLLAQMVVDNFNDVFVNSIDIDPTCEKFGERLSGYDNRIRFITHDISTYNDYQNASCIINTAIEHLDIDAYSKWFDNLPRNRPIILQSNNFSPRVRGRGRSAPGPQTHINTSDTLEEFIKKSKMKKIIYTGTLDCVQFDRYMIIGTK